MTKLATLKQLILESKDIEKPINYFFDLIEENYIFNLTSHREIKTIEKQSELSALLDVIQHSVGQRLRKPIKILNSQFYSALDHYFYHGACYIQDFPLPLTALYFSDIKTGIFVTSDMKNMEYFRFSLIKIEGSTKVH